MKIKTKAFGEIEVSEKQRLHFKDGIFGFEDIQNFVLLDGESGSPFYWLQSEEMSEIAFLVIDPKMIVADYKLEIDKEDIRDLEIEKDEDILLFTIITIYDDPEKSTANLLGPLVINRIKHIGKQVISLNDAYSVRHPLLEKKEA